MGAIELPPGLLRMIDALRLAFLWNFERRASGARCLISWEQVYRPKKEGGLGIRCLSMQNMCLQIKLLHRLHSAPDTPWASWTWRSLEGQAIAGKKMIAGLHWASLIKLMPVYHAISTIAIGDGQHTCFWTDDRLGGGTLQLRFPTIYSHVVKPDMSVTAHGDDTL
jgi:hypothetical protein